MTIALTANTPASAVEPTGAAVATLERSGSDLLESDLLEDELLVEEISIDGMCGVY